MLHERPTSRHRLVLIGGINRLIQTNTVPRFAQTPPSYTVCYPDADPATADGHVMRLLTPATSMERRGADVLFICGALPVRVDCGRGVKLLVLLDK
ncbi:hypothetical protein ABH989_002986 [Bradyrhizobium ottawaense]|nr:hypothetical protein BwSH14_03550 [Bradyrhizobium ottawaense]